jgi:hypothetical protein
VRTTLLPQDEARLEYGRLLWKRPRARERLLRHWLDPRHPYSDRFSGTYRPHVERLLESASSEDEALEREFEMSGLSFRVVVREIPPVFGSFY